MMRFFVERDDDGDEEGPSNNRPPKKRRTSPSVRIHRRSNPSAASTSNSGDRAGASISANPPTSPTYSNHLQEPQFRLEESSIVDYVSEDESDEEVDHASDPSEEDDEEDGEEDEDEDEDEEEERIMQSVGEIQPTEGGVDSTANGNSTSRETVRPTVDAPAPISVTLTDPDVLDCPICLEPLSTSVYQCENGHIACASCCIKMKNKCASCCWPIGYNRCRAIEKVLESVRISCRNMQYGCMESLNYSKKLDHEKTCNYAPCSCPHLSCTYVGLPKCLYAHFAAQHPTSCKHFLFNCDFFISLHKDENHAFLQEKNGSILFVLSRSIESPGSYVNVSCIAQASSRKEFSYELTATDGVSSIKLTTVAENTPQWTAQPPAGKYVIVPNNFLALSGLLQLEITIWKDPVSKLR